MSEDSEIKLIVEYLEGKHHTFVLRKFLSRIRTLLETIGGVSGMYDIALEGPVEPGEESQQEAAVEFELIMKELREL